METPINSATQIDSKSDLALKKFSKQINGDKIPELAMRDIFESLHVLSTRLHNHIHSPAVGGIPI